METAKHKYHIYGLMTLVVTLMTYEAGMKNNQRIHLLIAWVLLLIAIEVHVQLILKKDEMKTLINRLKKGLVSEPMEVGFSVYLPALNMRTWAENGKDIEKVAEEVIASFIKAANNHGSEEGDIYSIPDGRKLKVMSVKEGYVTARYAGCMPFVKAKIDFEIMLSELSARKQIVHSRKKAINEDQIYKEAR